MGGARGLDIEQGSQFPGFPTCERDIRDINAATVKDHEDVCVLRRYR